MSFRAFRNGYGYEKLAVVTDVGIILAYAPQGNEFEVRVLDADAEVDYDKYRLVQDDASKEMWEGFIKNGFAGKDDMTVLGLYATKSNNNDDDEEESQTSVEEEGDEEVARAMRPILQAAGLDVPRLFLLVEDGFEELKFD